MTTSSAADVLGVLSRADRRWAAKTNDVEQDVAYLEHLTAAVTAHLAGKQQHRMSTLETLVSAILLDDYDPDWDLIDQAQEAVRIIQFVHTYLLGVGARMRGAA
jgi:hypothetical protein